MMKHIYVSPLGDNGNIGSKEAPIKSIQKAVDLAVQMNREYWNGEVTVYLMGGMYELSAPVKVKGDVQLRITSAPGEKAVVSGGRALNGVCEGEMNGLRLWTVDLPEVKAGKWYFKSLFAGETRRPRACLPREGFYWMEDVPGHTVRDQLFDGADRFIAREGDMKEFRNLTDAEMAALRETPDGDCLLKITASMADYKGTAQYLVFRFYRYTERHAYMTVEVLDSADAPSSPQNAQGRFYVLQSFCDKLVADANRVLIGEEVIASSKN